MHKKFTPPLKAKNLIWLFVVLAALCVFSGGCGGHSGSVGGSGDADVEALDNKAFESSSETVTGTAKDSSGNSVNVGVSNFYAAFSSVTTAAVSEQSVQTAATTGTVTVSYDLTINGKKQNYQETKSNVALTETASGVYAFSFNDLSITIDPTSNKVTFGGKFKFGDTDTEYTLDKPIEIGVTKKTSTPVTTDMDVNAVWNGGWVAGRGTVSIDMASGVSLTGAVKNISVFFESCDVASPDGSATMSALFYVSASNDVIKLPVVFDREKIATSRDKTNEKVWEAKTNNNGDFNITVIDETHATFNGTFTFANAKIECSAISLVKPTTGTDMGDISSKIKGTWQSNNESANGGFQILSNSSGLQVFLGRGGYLNQIISDDFMKVDALMPATMVGTSSATALPIMLSTDVSALKLENIFGKVYRFDVNSDSNSSTIMKGVIAFENASADKATMVTVIGGTNTTVSASGQSFSVFELTKMTGDEINIASSLLNTEWEAEQAVGMAATLGTAVLPLVMSADKPFKVDFTDINISNRTATISADGLFTVSTNSALSYDVGQMIGQLTKTGSNSVTLPVSKIGFNTWYASGEHSKITVILMSEDAGYVSVVLNPQQSSMASLVGQMKKKK